ncbi:SigE family RNA polymerase sigma factor [Catenulispora sp. NF23]|uniref:SigE family RNA polymerase sigma factor n=1 Tax=Catenulispora pinistramenti TaxID=2705254 RepID=A0ABS5L8M1_9ACTN|nr:SigE family RNA polymerase sigma factor [Catenulispora pinistramenti]MBS2540155.1 SigE family RNA polymerase sigma factor [Catenulispora pinistramenti]MBS2554703.1 SigE family RNA polymerase sigma factor [Catenulispora pinistramenti]
MARGDKAAVEDELEQFVQGRYLALRRTAYLLCGDWHRAEDLVQGTLVKVVVVARRHRVDSLDAYSRQVLLRLFLDENRRLWRRRERLWAEPLEVVDGTAGDSDVKLTVLSALRGLPPRQRAAVVLRYWEDRSVEETAALLDISPGTVKSQCSRALAALRTVLQDDRLGLGIGSEGASA